MIIPSSRIIDKIVFDEYNPDCLESNKIVFDKFFVIKCIFLFCKYNDIITFCQIIDSIFMRNCDKI